MKTPEISVVIPTKNGVVTIRDCIDGIISQKIKVLEIIVIDSGSTDGLLDIVGEYSEVKIVRIEPEMFNHGLTRNIGVDEAKGEFILFTVQDAKPVDENWISHLMSGFLDVNVVGVCGSQVVCEDEITNPIEWFSPVSKPSMTTYQYDIGKYELLSPLEKKISCGWDNVSSIYRKSILIKHPFREIIFGEDAHWASDVLSAGHCIVFNPIARVYHYHNYKLSAAVHRNMCVVILRYTVFGYVGKNSNVIISILKVSKNILLNRRLLLLEKMYWFGYNVKMIIAEKYVDIIFKRALKKGVNSLRKLQNRYSRSVPDPNNTQRR